MSCAETAFVQGIAAVGAGIFLGSIALGIGMCIGWLLCRLIWGKP